METAKDTNAAAFRKEKILKMERYSNRRDLLEALLEEDAVYTLEEVNAKISRFMGGEE